MPLAERDQLPSRDGPSGPNGCDCQWNDASATPPLVCPSSQKYRLHRRHSPSRPGYLDSPLDAEQLLPSLYPGISPDRYVLEGVLVYAAALKGQRLEHL